MKQLTKDPDATLDYGFDWTEWLGTDTISDVVVTVTPTDAVVVDSVSESEGIVTTWISGGADNSIAIVTCQVVTAQNRIDNRSILLKIDRR